MQIFSLFSLKKSFFVVFLFLFLLGFIGTVYSQNTTQIGKQLCKYVDNNKLQAVKNITKNNIKNPLILDYYCDNQDRTPLMIALDKGYEKIAQYLIGAGANVNAKNKDGWTPLMTASRYGHINIAQNLINAKADVNIKKNDGWTALMLASYNGYKDIAQMLIDAGADVNAKNKYGWTALMLASYNGSTDVVELLIKNRANINDKDNYNYTALILATEKDELSVVEFLLNQLNIDACIKNKYGKTALDYFLENHPLINDSQLQSIFCKFKENMEKDDCFNQTHFKNKSLVDFNICQQQIITNTSIPTKTPINSKPVVSTPTNDIWKILMFLWLKKLD